MKLSGKFKYYVSTWESKFSDEEAPVWLPLPGGGRCA